MKCKSMCNRFWLATGYLLYCRWRTGVSMLHLGLNKRVGDEALDVGVGAISGAFSPTMGKMFMRNRRYSERLVGSSFQRLAQGVDRGCHWEPSSLCQIGMVGLHYSYSLLCYTIQQSKKSYTDGFVNMPSMSRVSKTPNSSSSLHYSSPVSTAGFGHKKTTHGPETATSRHTKSIQIRDANATVL